MTDFSPHQLVLADAHRVDRDREGIAMLLHEALARARQQEAEQAAAEHRLARRLRAGRRWTRLARFAERRAERARRHLGVV
ncbi:hypothetical protein [Pseudonocardia acidicola]|uniref:Uncharacterized protein n=1 Tax=Pseudonocardia acidicola TaxID=2724939 RepID=A0ABX1S6B7_9PSEU|nr:hypothetical protein [Pseudonocardia acidicola]NMH97116.1 hypothetical protein [Pseudonocardia acidicola]